MGHRFASYFRLTESLNYVIQGSLHVFPLNAHQQGQRRRKSVWAHYCGRDLFEALDHFWISDGAFIDKITGILRSCWFKQYNLTL